MLYLLLSLIAFLLLGNLIALIFLLGYIYLLRISVATIPRIMGEAISAISETAAWYHKTDSASRTAYHRIDEHVGEQIQISDKYAPKGYKR